MAKPTRREALKTALQEAIRAGTLPDTSNPKEVRQFLKERFSEHHYYLYQQLVSEVLDELLTEGKTTVQPNALHKDTLAPVLTAPVISTPIIHRTPYDDTEITTVPQRTLEAVLSYARTSPGEREAWDHYYDRYNRTVLIAVLFADVGSDVLKERVDKLHKFAKQYQFILDNLREFTQLAASVSGEDKRLALAYAKDFWDRYEDDTA